MAHTIEQLEAFIEAHRDAGTVFKRASFPNTLHIETPVILKDGNVAFPMGWEPDDIIYWRAMMELPGEEIHERVIIGAANDSDALFNRFYAGYLRRNARLAKWRMCKQAARWLVGLD